MTQPEILFHRHHHAGVVTINRPETLNAVTYAMILGLHAQLVEWEDDPAVKHVIIKAASGRAFSAGGDIRNLYERGRAGKPNLQFFWDEYRLNAYIKSYPKPYIALIDGIVMGGGVGISFHGSHRIAGDNIAFAMPEVGIGFFPDVGGSYFLPRMPGETGMYLALTGNRIKKEDCLWAGLATHACSSDRLPEIEEAICRSEDAEIVLENYLPKNSEDDLAAGLDEVNTAFGGETVDKILLRLDAMAFSRIERISQWATETLATIKRKSPTSLAIALRQLRQGRGLSMPQCMQLEYRIVSAVLEGHDFYEGIRAAIIDKDNTPGWKPATLEQVDPQAIDAIFAARKGNRGTLGGELQFE